MSDMTFVTPEGWPRARGYSFGVSSTGRGVWVSGQVAKHPGDAAVSENADFVTQWALALKNVVAVVTAAGGQATDIVILRVFVTDIADFRNNGESIAASWKETLGNHYPAITIVQVGALMDPHATVEIEAEATLHLG